MREGEKETMKVHVLSVPVGQFLPFLVVLLLHQTCAIMVTLKGSESIVYDLRSSPIGAENNRITFRFKTIHPDGLILFSKGTQDDYISICLEQGMIRYEADLGTTFDSTSKQKAFVGRNLADNEWHTVHINRREKSANVSVDNDHKLTCQSGGMFKRLDLDGKLYVGGKLDGTKTLRDLGLVQRSYIGCLENFILDDVDILYNVKYNIQHFRSYGDLYYDCPAIDYFPATFPNPMAVIKIPSYVYKSLIVKLSFKTYLAHGLLLSKVSSKGKIFLGIRYNKLFVQVTAPNKTPLMLQLGQNLNDGRWHRVILIVDAELISVSIDGGIPIIHRGIWLKDNSYLATEITLAGGAEHLFKGFVGCIHDLFLDGTFIDFRVLKGATANGALINKCEIKNLCWPNPCRNHGKCTQDWRSFKCDCRGTMFNDKFCDNPIVQKTCEDYRYLGLKEDSYCTIDPDGKGKLEPFEILCNVSNGEKATNVILLQKKIGQIKVSDTTSFVAGKYFHLLKYGANMASLEKLIQLSTSCRQYVRYDCKSSPLLNSPRGPPFVEWVNGRGSIESYWGGAIPGSEKCACGMNRTCADKNKYCNCDKGDAVWRFDDGYLRDKTALPVSMLQFDESTGGSYFQIGNLECIGETTINKKEPKLVAALRACRPVIYRTTPNPTTVATTTYKTMQKEVTLTNFHTNTLPWSTQDTKQPTLNTPRHEHKNKGGTASVNVNVTLGITEQDQSARSGKDGLTISMSVLAVIAISATIVLVWVIIAVIVLVRRKRASRSRSRRSQDEDENVEGTEMCVLFRTSEKQSARPTIEIRRHSFRTDSTDTFSDVGYRGFHQPITTHIDLNYKPRKKSRGGLFC